MEVNNGDGVKWHSNNLQGVLSPKNPVYMPMELYVDLVKLFGTLTFVSNC